MTDTLTILLAGGGTAGHIEPALAVGEALRHRHDAQVEALGTPKGLEKDIVPARGFSLHMIDPVPIPRKKPLKLIGVPAKVAASVRQARAVLKKTGADAVFGTGGYVSASAYLAAKSLGVPFYVLETNALAGLANKLGVRLGGVGFNAVDNSGMPGETVGIPVRPNLSDPQAATRAREQWGLSDRPVLLVTGGSQGAVSLNVAVNAARERLIADGWQILHAYGPKNPQPEEMEHYVGLPYIDDMPAALAVADLTVCRSGAMTVAEVSASTLPAIYVPLPHGNGEQGRNSQHIVDAGGAVQVPDAELDGDRLVAEVRRADLAAMRGSLAKSGASDVAAQLADRIVRDLRKEK
ncbi:UDP-N-acetylglucosamine--N-acetylmuramyl-(pentapeptide) pyrophosphoryl-undecaprenol N-acetylglucosamine transferase [Corynebacterium uterequi]|uniref:UDP-N-acetylglucosamine--N-acetylmuramyl-(pentapeptide) pyrophosphoryl-undecaprenol N-acetylglucosamine transferase n=1 Tax=Corynebacterium uterequi TaxID=1072256 RepID=A0A0G3HHP2_9CORY|nr:UDP-N-acetylglucosamine--N-acetylmuramyl-(pentapeptide) pyrophosphoryl-undecaprenol N-acetylglucosamine transferase [Corynebacterium uterequi]AKK11458.1 UDP-N-acetylglucosamine-N-acetylmuramyl-(pentapeptide) pyrophosphoryl-undecaprenol N-acetylglucosamine transferase [Corynebacterium uterequi]